MLRLLSLLSLFTLGAAVYACGGYGSLCPAAGTPEFDEQAAALRLEGPAGLEVALRRFENATEESDRAKLSQLVDQVAGQRDATVSRLYWYADLEQAKQAAAESGRPILSLRMLGKLTDEFSCANSRFFRTALYANKEISDYLRDNFVLHWQSVRPVPRMTVDFGDGRKLERTITGNSAHYVLDAQGRPLEALPGLYGPRAFADWLRRSHDFSRRVAKVAEAQRDDWLISYHGERKEAVDEALRMDLGMFAPQLLEDHNAPEQTAAPEQDSKPTAREAAFRAVAKTRAEAPLVAPFMPSDEMLQAQNNDLWKRIATAHSDKAKLDDASIALIRSEHPTAQAAGLRAYAKAAQEDPLARLLRNFEESMALDTVKNEYLLHRKIHEWFVNREVPADADAFNERVYAELFLTPSSDPWLGLAPDNVYTALDSGGLTEARPAK